MMDALARASVVDAALQAHYLALPGRTLDGWKAVKQDPAKYSRVWRHALGMQLRDEPPAEDERMVDPSTGEWLG